MIVKICGLVRPHDAAEAANAGADWLGINFWPQSKRFVGDDDNAEAVIAAARAMRPDIVIVGLFVNAEPARIDDATARHALDRVQLHGDESPEAVARCGPTAFKAIGVRTAADLSRAIGYPGDVILLDTKTAGYGGSGERFDWSLAVQAVAGGHNVIVAGGLGPANVGDGVAETGCFGVDVASGVESAPGEKDRAAMNEFVARAREAARRLS